MTEFAGGATLNLGKVKIPVEPFMQSGTYIQGILFDNLMDIKGIRAGIEFETDKNFFVRGGIDFATGGILGIGDDPIGTTNNPATNVFGVNAGLGGGDETQFNIAFRWEMESESPEPTPVPALKEDSDLRLWFTMGIKKVH